MPRQPRRARLQPGFHLEKIEITLPLGPAPAVVHLSGRSITGNPRVDAMTRISAVTTALPPSGQTFIAEMVAMFSGAAAHPSTSGE